MNRWPNSDERWKICQSFLSSRGANEQNIASFDAFIGREFQKEIYKNFRIECSTGVDNCSKLSVYCKNVEVRDCILLNNDIDVHIPSHVKVTDALARLLKCSLVSPVYLTICLKFNNRIEEIRDVLFCYLPIMVGSCLTLPRMKHNLCDEGFFILNGAEKTIVVQQRKVNRMIQINKKRAEYVCDANMVCRWWLEKTDEGELYLNTKHGKCLAVTVMSEFCIEQSHISPLLHDAKMKVDNKSQIERMVAIKKCFPMLKTSVADLPHILFPNFDSSLSLVQFTYMSNMLIHDETNYYDRDHLHYKRVEMPSELLLIVLRKSLTRVLHSFKKRILNFIEKFPSKSLITAVHRSLDNRVITEAMFYSLQTGNFPLPNNQQGIRTGVSQQRSNYNFSSALSQSRRLRSGDVKRAIIQQREVRSDTYGYLCAFDTQEGKQCGCSKHMSTLTTVSVEFEQCVIEQILNEKKMLHKPDLSKKSNLIFINGFIYGQNDNINDTANIIRQYRRIGIIDKGVSVHRKKGNLYIRSDCGRILRPLFHLKNLYEFLRRTSFQEDEQNLNFFYLLKNGVIEYIDSSEENEMLVAENFQSLTKDTTHVELHPSLMLSMNALANNPFCNHNQGPRLTYQCAMQKQSQSEMPLNYKDLNYSRAHYLYNGQTPLCESKLGKMAGMPQASGCNVIMAIMCHDGYNQEDSLVFNKGSIERGLFRMIDMKTYHYSGSDLVGFKNDDVHVRRKHSINKFKKVDNDGLPTPGKNIAKDDVIIAKKEKIDPETKIGGMNSIVANSINIQADMQNEPEYRDSSVSARDKFGIVERVIVGCGTRRRKQSVCEKSSKVTIITSKMRSVSVGDKFASRHAQKGVCARIVPQEDMPFSCGGMNSITPDVILSPCAIPTRMTIGVSWSVHYT